MATIGLKIITMWRSSMTRAAGWRVGDYRKAWRGSTRLHALIAQFVPERWAVLEPGEGRCCVEPRWAGWTATPRLSC